MTQETALGAASRSAAQTVSEKKQIGMIADHIYSKHDVLKRFRPLAVGTDQDLVTALSQSDPSLTARMLANHCRRPRYLRSLVRGGKRFDLNNRFKGEVSPEEQVIAQQHPAVQQDLAAQVARKATTQEEQPETASVVDVSPAGSETPAV